MHSTQVIRVFQADNQGLGNRLLRRSGVVLVVGVVLAAIVFFSKNPFRVGEITVATPNGPSVTVKVANSNELSELIQKGLENETTVDYVTNSLLNIIENLPSDSKLGEKLVELAEHRKHPFSSNTVQAPNAFTVIEEAVKDMEKANIAFNTPQTMNRDDTVMIHLLLSLKDAADELKEKIREKGEKESAVVRVAPIMEARLTGPNFQITAVTPEEQGVSGHDNTEWKWEVKPQASGEQHLHLTLNALFMVNGSQRKWSVRSFDKIITVQVTTGQRLAGFVSANWQWLWTVLAAPLVVAVWNHQKAKTRQQGTQPNGPVSAVPGGQADK